MNKKKEIINLIKKELKTVIYLFLALTIVFQIVFYKENIFTTIRTVFGIFWLFIIPGYTLMLLWKDRFDFIERIICGTVLGITIISITSYYFTMFGLHIRSQFILIPLFIVVITLILLYRSIRAVK